ncbi:MAG TPA: CRISPR-associated endonuclease Cas6 [Phaeodactylibacter sp.]|nr:CRISPR-associated endonuclease Cas6 [Phaeodactylibacter sp.]
MSVVKLIRLRFDTPIQPDELPVFRDVISDYLGFTGMYIVQGDWHTAGELIDFERNITPPVPLVYPLLQWRLRRDGNGYTPELVCISDRLEKVEESLVHNGGSKVIVNDRPYSMWCRPPKHETLRISTGDRRYTYELQQYLPVEGQNLLAFNQIRDQQKRRSVVDRMLLNHLMLFAKVVGADMKRELRVDNLFIYPQEAVTIGGQSFNAFRLQFQSNLNIPDDVGLGCKAGLGYGIVKAIR